MFFVCLFVCLFLFVKLFVFVPTSLDVICEVHRARGSCTNLHYHYHLILLEGAGGRRKIYICPFESLRDWLQMDSGVSVFAFG